MKNKNRLYKLLFVLYSLIIAKIVFFRTNFFSTIKNWNLDIVKNKLQTANFVPFHTIKLYMKNIYPKISIINLVGNIVVFIPLGFMIPHISKNKNIFSILYKSIIFIMVIELSQLISGMGEFDVDDIILNILGSFLGYIIYLIFNK